MIRLPVISSIHVPAAVDRVSRCRISCHRGDARRPIFRDDNDRLLFLDVLHAVVSRFHWLCHAHCLMGNYCHLLIETPEGNPSRGTRQFNRVNGLPDYCFICG